VRVDAAGKPDEAVYAQHSGGERCGWASVRRRDDAPVAFLANGSHAAYFRPGVRDRTFPDPNDEAEGHGRIQRARCARQRACSGMDAVFRSMGRQPRPRARPGRRRRRRSRRARTRRRLVATPAGKARGMTTIPLPPLPRPEASSPPPARLSQAGRAAHDLGLAGLLGGNLFGRRALHPSVTEISDQEERGKVVNAAWKR
jgi:hypothetical protein